MNRSFYLGIITLWGLLGSNMYASTALPSASLYSSDGKTKTPSEFFGSIDSQSIRDKTDNLSIISMMNSSPGPKEPTPDFLTDQIMTAILARDLTTFCTLINDATANRTFNIDWQINTSYNVTLQNGTVIPLFPIQLVTLLLVDRANFPIRTVEEDDTSLLTAMLRILLAEGADVHARTIIDGKLTTSAYGAACTLAFPADSLAPELIKCADADHLDELIWLCSHEELAYALKTPRFQKAIEQYCSAHRHKIRLCALQTAVQKGCQECVEILLQAGASPHVLASYKDHARFKAIRALPSNTKGSAKGS
jgi:hypothetical protein